MKNKKLIVLLIAAAIVLAALIPNLVFVSSGIHRMFGRYSYNLSGTGFVYDGATGKLIEAVPVRVKTIQPLVGEMNKKIVFRVEGYLDIDALNAENAEADKANGVFRAGTAVCGAYGLGSLFYRIAEYRSAGEGGDPVYLEPRAVLSRCEDGRNYLIELLYGSDTGARYIVKLGPDYKAAVPEA